MLSDIRALNLDSIYERGFDSIQLPRLLYQEFLSALSDTRWIPDEDDPVISIPDWAFGDRSSSVEAPELAPKVEREKSKNMLLYAPEKLVDCCHSLLADPTVMGIWLDAFKPNLKVLTSWNGADNVNWHWDGPLQSDFFFLIYLQKKKGWNPDIGGQLSVGVRSLAFGYMSVDPASVTPLDTIQPASRTLVCCNNSNPRFVHKVTPMSQKDDRVVVMVSFDMIPTMAGQRYDSNPDF